LAVETEHLRVAKLVVETATSGEEALQKLEQVSPEVIVTNVMMPGITGYELCSRARGRGLLVGFVFLSVVEDKRVIGVRTGVDEYLVKTAGSEELVLVVRRQIVRQRKLALARKHEQIERYERLRRLTELAKEPVDVMNGALGAITCADLLQVVGLLGLDVCVRVESARWGVGEVFLSNGCVKHASAQGFAGEKAFNRLVAWDEGTYIVFRKTPAIPPSSSLDSALLRAASLLDQKRRLASDLGIEGAPLTIHPAMNVASGSFDEETASILSLIERFPTLDGVLDHSKLSDADTLHVLDELLRAGILLHAPELSTLETTGSLPRPVVERGSA
jgi:CheY-like chemotaxis protein